MTPVDQTYWWVFFGLILLAAAIAIYIGQRWPPNSHP